METKLINAVQRQLGGRDQLKEVARHCNANAGWPGFTYYSDTIAFFKRHRAAIVSAVKEMAEEMGQDVISFVASFQCLDDDIETRDEIGRALYGRLRADDTLVPNALAWFALEEAARAAFPNL